jgi:Integrase core domain
VLRRSVESAQYTSIEFGRRCRDAGVRPSMGSVGDAYDNAMCESFFATLESRFKTQAEARHAIFEFVEGFYNLRRRHSSIGYLSPVEYERRHPATRSIPTHTSLPSCSRPSRTNPSGGPKKGPSLTAAVRDGRTIVRAGTEEWLRPEPNQRMSRNGTPVCRQIR